MDDGDDVGLGNVSAEDVSSGTFGGDKPNYEIYKFDNPVNFNNELCLLNDDDLECIDEWDDLAGFFVQVRE